MSISKDEDIINSSVHSNIKIVLMAMNQIRNESNDFKGYIAQIDEAIISLMGSLNQ